MNAKPRFRERTAAEIGAQIKDLEREMVRLQRDHSAARTALPGLIVSGDTDAIAQGRARVTETQDAVRKFEQTLNSLREAHTLAQEQERRSGAAQRLSELKQLEKRIETAASAIDAALDTFGERLRDLVSTMDAKDRLLSGLGVNPDHWLLRAKLIATVEMRLWLATDGKLGEKRTLDNAHQLKQSGRASVGRLASEAAAVELRSIRAALGIDEPSPPQAA